MKHSFLMCMPTHFDVSYVINPWMDGNINAVSVNEANLQWEDLLYVISCLAQVKLVLPERGLPDMVFTANAGVLLGNDVVLSRFRFKERQREEEHFQKWFEGQGFRVHKLPPDLPFEGGGDALLDRRLPLLWIGHGHRSQFEAGTYVQDFLNIEVEPLLLVDPRFYHLDTCFCPLSNGHLLYYPAAFDEASLRLIHSRVPKKLRIPVSEEEALHFACNAVNIDKSVILNRASDDLKRKLAEAGYHVFEIPLSQFLKAGGGAKCLTLRLDEPRI